MNNLQEIESFANELIKEYLPNYSFRINHRLKATNGRIFYRERLIELAGRVAERASQADVLNVLLHEIAHGLHPKDGHGRLWKAEFIRLGGNGRRCNTYKGAEREAPKVRWIFTCKGEHFVQKRARRPKTEGRYCPKCVREGLGKSNLVVKEA